jgi:Competence protein CoiA-like family
MAALAAETSRRMALGPADVPRPTRHGAGRRPELRQLFARDRRLSADAPLVFIEPGAAQQLRADCHAGHLVCPFPGCPDPRLITRGGSRRAHFAHRRAGDAVTHAPERWYHLCAKHLIGAWVRRSCPEARVRVDHEAVDNGQVPDVLVVLPDSRRLVFEIQYAPLTIDAWRARHAGYQAQGIVDTWLFGHIPPHLRAARGQPGDVPRFIFSELLEAVELAGGRARWIDPDERTIRTPLHAAGPRRVSAPTRAWLLVEAPPEPLDACRLDEGGLCAPADAAQALVRAEHLAELAREVEARAARDRQLDERRRSVAVSKERRRAALERAWEVYRHAKFARPDAVPVIIAEAEAADAGIADHLPAHWHARLFEEVIQGRIGSTFTYGRAAAPFLGSPAARPRAVYRALSAYLERLRRAGYVAYRAGAGGYITTAIRVLADTKHRPETRPSERRG